MTDQDAQDVVAAVAKVIGHIRNGPSADWTGSDETSIRAPSPVAGWAALELSELWEYRELLYFLPGVTSKSATAAAGSA